MLSIQCVARRVLSAAILSFAALPAANAIPIPFDVMTPAGPYACCGVPFVADGVNFMTRGFRDGAGALVTTGSASQMVPGWNGTPTLHLNNICAAPNIAAVAGPGGSMLISFSYRDAGGNINLRVNGALQNRANFSLLGAYPGVAVNVVVTAAGIGYEEGIVQLMFAGSAITTLQIGGQELQIDNLDLD